MSHPGVPARGRLRRWLFALAAAGLAATLVAGFFGAQHPALDSIAHFRAHLAVLAAVFAVTGLLVFGRLARTAGLALLALSAVAGWTVVPFMVPAGTAPGQAADRGVLLLQMNLLFTADTDDAVARIAGIDPDFVTLQEARPDLVEALAAAGVSYPHVARCSAGGFNAALVILSRHPFVAGEGHCDARNGFLSRRVRLDGRTMTLATQHLRWPWPFSQWYLIRGLADVLRAIEPPAVIAGDFNAASWSAAVRTFARLAGTRPVEGIGPTWLLPAFADGWRRVAGLPIDNVLVSPEVTVLGVRRPAATASDHLPVLVRLAP